MDWTHRCLIVPAEHVELVRALTLNLAGPGGSGMFTTPLSPTGEYPATHYISSGAIEKPFADLLPLVQVELDNSITVVPGNPDEIVTLAGNSGFETTLNQVKALLDSSDVSEQDPFTAMSRLGLQLVQQQDII